MCKTVLVLLSTYNGEKYLAEQLDTILNQTKKNILVSILIRDDGSKDDTLNIIEKYKKNYDCIELVEGDNVGPAQSYRKLIQLARDDFDYYAFADQDDIWLEDKISIASGDMECADSGIPILWYSAVLKKYSDGRRAYFHCDVERANDFRSIIETFATTNGCSMVFNNALFKILKAIPDGVIDMHDSWINAVCIACGGMVISNKKAYVIYRMHDGQVLGNKSTSLNSLKRSLMLCERKRSKTVKLIYDCKCIERDKKKYLEPMLDYNDWRNKLAVIFRKKPGYISNKEHLKFKLQVLLNRY